jgi:hypothetical protein
MAALRSTKSLGRELSISAEDFEELKKINPDRVIFEKNHSQ